MRFPGFKIRLEQSFQCVYETAHIHETLRVTSGVYKRHFTHRNKKLRITFGVGRHTTLVQ